MNKQTEFDFLKKQSLFRGLSDEQVLSIQEKLVQEQFHPADIIIEEEDATTDLYLIVEGEVSVIKWNEDHCAQSLIGKLGVGEVFGEISFLEPSIRSTTIKAIKPTTTLKLTREAVSGNLMSEVLSKMYTNIAIVNTKRLRILNTLYVKNLQNHERIFQTRQNRGKSLVYQYLILCCSIAIAAFFKEEIRNFVPWLIAVIPAVMLFRASGYNWLHFGINYRNVPMVIAPSMFTLAIIVGVIYFINFALQDVRVDGFFYWMPSITMNNFLLTDLLAYAGYCLSQELIARGILQNLLQDFFQDAPGYKSIFVNAGFLLIFFFPLGYLTAVNVFLISLPMGYFYQKQRTIVGAFLIHFFLLLLGFVTV